MTADGFDWQVAGFRDELVAALVRTLPKDYPPRTDARGRDDAAAYGLLARPTNRGGGLGPAVEAVVPSVRVPPRLRRERVPDHLRITFAVHDDDRCCGRHGKDLDEISAGWATLRAAVAGQPRSTNVAASPVGRRRPAAAVDTVRGGHVVHGYPALLDDGDSVSLRVFTKPELQERVMRGGVKRLLLLAVPVGKRGGSAAHQPRQVGSSEARRRRRRPRRPVHRRGGRPGGGRPWQVSTTARFDALVARPVQTATRRRSPCHGRRDRRRRCRDRRPPAR